MRALVLLLALFATAAIADDLPFLCADGQEPYCVETEFGTVCVCPTPPILPVNK